MLWSAYHCVHGTSCFVLCQPVHSCIEPSLHGLDFFLEIFLETCFCSFLIIIFSNLLCGTAHIIAVDASSAHMCIDEWCPTASTTLPPQSSPQKISCNYAQNKKDRPSSENFLATGDLFECNTCRVMALGCLKKKEDEQF